MKKRAWGELKRSWMWTIVHLLLFNACLFKLGVKMIFYIWKMSIRLQFLRSEVSHKMSLVFGSFDTIFQIKTHILSIQFISIPILRWKFETRSGKKKEILGTDRIWNLVMAGQNEQAKSAATEEFVYRISTSKEWDESQRIGHIYGGELDKSSGFIHLSNLNQVLSLISSVSLLSCRIEEFCSFHYDIA